MVDPTGLGHKFLKIYSLHALFLRLATPTRRQALAYARLVYRLRLSSPASLTKNKESNADALDSLFLCGLRYGFVEPSCERVGGVENNIKSIETQNPPTRAGMFPDWSWWII